MKILGLLIAVALCASCGGNSSDSSADTTSSTPKTHASTKCVTMPATMVKTISGGFTHKGKITKAALYPLPKADQAFNYKWLIAAKVTDPQTTETAILASGGKNHGPVLAVDGIAKLYFSWGAAAKSGSPIDNYRKSLYVSDTRPKAEACL